MSRLGRGEFVIDLCVEIPVPARAVYALLADIQDAEPIPRRAAVRMAKEPTGVTTIGTRWHEAVKFAPGLWMHVDSVVTDALEPHRLAMDFESIWWSGNLSYDIEATSSGNLLHHRELLRPTLILRPLTGLIERRLRVRIEERLHDIRDVLVDGRRATDPRRAAGC